MPLYEMLCISPHIKQYQHIRELVRQSAMHVMNSGGVVRKINSWGTRTLPQRMKRTAGPQRLGDYWTLHFDASPATLRSLNGIMRRDPRVLRWTVLKLADELEELAKQGKRIEIDGNRPVTVEDIID
ncbi:ribosomal protein S6 [Crassisporium funariophilum]|nr:ribosomal protein S6 [Crassisporium funariophilum]